MAAIDCKQFLNQLDAWMDGQRTADAQAHLRAVAISAETWRTISAPSRRPLVPWQQRNWNLPLTFGLRCARNLSAKV